MKDEIGKLFAFPVSVVIVIFSVIETEDRWISTQFK